MKKISFHLQQKWFWHDFYAKNKAVYASLNGVIWF